jgi:DNA-binding GntR family transcriptional regulator
MTRSSEESLADRAYDAIRQDIISCRLEPGEQVAQSLLSDRYSLGVTPIREALQRLANEGFVQAIPRHGYIITPVTITDVLDLFAVRALMEGASVRWAAETAPDKQLTQILDNAHFTYTYDNRQSYSHFLALNTEFHHSIAVASQNKRLATYVFNVLEELTRVFHLALHLRDSAEEMRDDHVALAEALVDRDSDRAYRLVAGEIARSRQRVLDALEFGRLRLTVSIQGHPLTDATWPRKG